MGLDQRAWVHVFDARVQENPYPIGDVPEHKPYVYGCLSIP